MSSIIPCTCSAPHILSQPGTPCLVEILSPSPDSLFLRSKRYGLVTPLSSHNSSPSLPLNSEKNEDTAGAQLGSAFQYYIPHISSNSVDYYTDASWAAFDMRDANERAETEAMLLDDFDLPFVDEEDFNYYPGRSPRPLYVAVGARMEESLVSGLKVEQAQKGKSQRFRLREMVGGLAKRMSCRQ